MISSDIASLSIPSVQSADSGKYALLHTAFYITKIEPTPWLSSDQSMKI